MKARTGLLLAITLALSACSSEPPRKVSPALWEVTGPGGQKAWLFGTIHALPEAVDWRSPAVDTALRGSDRLVMEISNPGDGSIARLYRELGQSPGQPEPAARVPAEVRSLLAQLMAKHGLDGEDWSTTETWSLALTLSRSAQGDVDTGHGIEAELLEASDGKPVIELEGAEAQLRGFDALPEAEQRDLLAAVVREATGPRSTASLATAWGKGDMAVLDRETRSGMLADPELRAALLVNRNRAWTERIAALLAEGSHPLVAVGAAHMAGTDGLPALLAARGFTVRRVQ